MYQKRWSSVWLKPFGQRCTGIIFCWFGATRASACQAEAQVSVMPAQVSGRGCKNPRFQSATRASACQVEAQVTVFWTESFFDQGWPGTINRCYTNPIIPIPRGIIEVLKKSSKCPLKGRIAVSNTSFQLKWLIRLISEAHQLKCPIATRSAQLKCRTQVPN